MPQKGFGRLLALISGSRRDKKSDTIFVALCFFLVAFGLVMLSSASAPVSFQRYGASYYFVLHQLLFGLIPGALIFFLCSHLDYHIWKKIAPFLLVFSIVLLILVLVPGIGAEHGGARRWIDLGPFSFQPSEVVKLTFLLYLAAWLSAKGDAHVKDAAYGFLPFVFLVGVVVMLVLIQPDFGTMAIISFMAVTMYIVGGARISHLALAFACSFPVVALIIISAPYRIQRFTAFLDPSRDPLGVGYHINQALLAIGSGGLWGRGFGLSRQKFAYLPEVFNDSIFAVIAEELGFVFSLLLIGVFLFFIMRLIALARRAPDMYGVLVCAGAVGWIGSQVCINIAAMLSLLPLTGIPLPFISYGGTALVVLLMAMGIVANISRQSTRT